MEKPTVEQLTALQLFPVKRVTHHNHRILIVLEEVTQDVNNRQRYTAVYLMGSSILWLNVERVSAYQIGVHLKHREEIYMVSDAIGIREHIV